MKRDVFTKKQEKQIKKSFDDMDKDLGIDKLDDEKGLQDIFERANKTRSSSPRGSAGGGMSPVDIEKGRQPGKVKFAKGGSVKSSASKRADGCATKGKTKGKMV